MIRTQSDPPHILKTTWNEPIQVKRPIIVVQAFNDYFVETSIDGQHWSIFPASFTDHTSELDPEDWDQEAAHTPIAAYETRIVHLPAIFLWVRVNPAPQPGKLHNEVYISY